MTKLTDAGITIILVDMQEYFLEKFREYHKNLNIDLIIQNQLVVIENCRKHNIPLIVLEHIDYGDTTDILKTEIDKLGNKTIIKKLYNCGFLARGLLESIQKAKAQKLFFMGISGNTCVRITANSAKEKYGYKILSSPDVITSVWNNKFSWYRKNGEFIPLSKLLN